MSSFGGGAVTAMGSDEGSVPTFHEIDKAKKGGKGRGRGGNTAFS